MVQGKSESLEDLIASHTPEAIRARLAESPNRGYLRDFIFGAIDGTVTTFAIVSGVAGAQLSSGVVVVLGFANLIGDGFSMAIGNYQATRAEDQLRHQARKIEKNHIDLYPDGEREEIRQILRNKGFEGDELERAVHVITANEERWIDTMLQEELGMSLTGPAPMRAAIVTFLAFVAVGLFPLVAFVLQLAAPDVITRPYAISIAMTAIAFFAVGAAKAKFVKTSWYWSGLETLVAGGAAAGLSYLVGMLLRGLI